jgi:hypothetical protein
LDQSAHLIDLAPEIRLLHRERVHHVLPFDVRSGIVFQQVVIVEIRPEATLDDEWREFVDQEIAFAVVEMHSSAFVNQSLYQTRGALR